MKTLAVISTQCLSVVPRQPKFYVMLNEESEPFRKVICKFLTPSPQDNPMGTEFVGNKEGLLQ